jgi:hypothetical protein
MQNDHEKAHVTIIYVKIADAAAGFEVAGN